MLDERTLQQARRDLLRWFRRRQRDLPWRHTQDPYAIWVAEIMLQQTRVDVVVPYYERFLGRYPDVARLAAAPLESVLQAWSGLGYYGRARNLHAAARRVVAEHGGVLPDDSAALRRLPGIGRYSAGAIASLAFGHPEPCLDGNAARVLARFSLERGAVEAAPAQKRLWELAARWARGPSPGAANQSLMELGALLCTPAAPRCDDCPLAPSCRARAHGLATTLPRPSPRTPSQVVHLGAALLRQGSKLLLVRRRSGRLLRDWWELPTCRLDQRRGAAPFRAQIERRGGIEVRSWRRQASGFRHGILAHRLQVALFAGTASGTAGSQPSTRRTATTATPLANLELKALDWRWVDGAGCARLPLTTLTRKALRAAARFDSTWQEYVHEPEGQGSTGERRRHPAEEHV